jgi:imidazolonepropionase-like amidohydrolase
VSRLAIVGATVLDGTGRDPLRDAVVLIDDGRITAVESGSAAPEGYPVLDAAGRYVIPGLMDANVHLCMPVAEEIVEAGEDYEARFAEMAEAAARALLAAGFTTVFDTWGPLGALKIARDRIDAGAAVGSRIRLAGTIVGFDGPLSPDFFAAPEGLSTDFVGRFNDDWVRGVGRNLMWLDLDGIRGAVRHYIESNGIDLVKYAASSHTGVPFLTFSTEVQRAIVEESHAAGLTVQAHTTSPESLRMAFEAGVDILQHGDVTGPALPIPEPVIAAIAARGTAVAAVVTTGRYLDWVTRNAPTTLGNFHSAARSENDRRLIAAGVPTLLTTDGFHWTAANSDHPDMGGFWRGAVDIPTRLGESHLTWLEGALEHGMSSGEALLAATRRVAEAYRVDDELGTLEPGKRADAVILDGDPLADVGAYGRIVEVVKDGRVVDRD